MLMKEALVETSAGAVRQFCDWLEQLRRNFIRPSEFLRQQTGAERQGSLLPQAAAWDPGGRAHDLLRGVPALGTTDCSGSRNGFPLPTPTMRWGLRSLRASTTAKSITEEQFISSKSFRRRVAGVTKTTAGDIRSTGRRELVSWQRVPL